MFINKKRLNLFNSILIIIIILFLLFYFIGSYFKSIENFSQNSVKYGIVACPPQFTKVGTTKNIYYNEGNIGINSINPGYRLDVIDSNTFIAVFRHSNLTQGIGIQYDGLTAMGSNSSQDIRIKSKNSGKVIFNTNNSDRAFIDSSGNLSVSGNLNVDGSFTVAGSTISTYSDADVESKLESGISGSIKFTQKRRRDTNMYQDTYNSWWNTYDKFVIEMGDDDCSIVMYDNNDIKFSHEDSDERIKTNIIKVNDNTEYMQYLRKCNMYKYNFKTKLDRNSKDILEDGFIAQEIENIIPKAVTMRTGIIKDIDTKCSIMNDVLELDISGKINYNIKENDVLQLIDDNSDKIKVTIKQIIGNNKYTIHQSEEIDYKKKYKVIGYVVDDLRNLDHNVLTRISIGAIKHVDNEVTKLKEIIKKQQEQIELLLRKLK